jgi:hypothetical protein
MPLPTFTPRADNADIIHAEDVNELQREVAPIAAATLAVRYSQVSTSTAITLTDSSYPLQSILSTATGLVTLPAYSTANHAFFVVNRSTSFSVDVKNSSAALVVSVPPITATTIYPDSVSGWKAGIFPPATTAANDVQIGDGAGAWIKKTLAEFSTIIQTSLDSVYLKLSNMSAANAASVIAGRDWFLAWETHFDTDPSWTWMNDPTGTGGIKTFGNSHFHIQAANDLNKVFYYRIGSDIPSYSMTAMGQIDTSCESGLRMDDGTDNNYWELYIKYVSAGYVKICKRVRTGGGSPTETDLITGLISQKYGLTFAHFSGSVYFYIFRDSGLSLTFAGSFSSVTPASVRYGIFATKSTTGSENGAWWDAFKTG